MKKLFLLDAYALIYRAYYAFMKNPRINSKGLNTSAIIGFVNTLNEVLTKEHPDYLGVAFDPHGPTFRHEAYPDYKAQREKQPEDITRAVPIIKDIITAFRIPILEMQGYEADDIIGTLATQAAAHDDLQTYMLTPDKDYGQLVRDNVFMFRPRFGDTGYDTWGPAQISEKYGVNTTSQIIDLLGLMGDASDNIPGCPGVGQKTAVKLINDFGSIDNLLAHIDDVSGKALKQKLTDNAEQIRFSKFLATIKTDVPLPLHLDTLRVEAPDTDRLEKIFAELEMKTIASRILGRKEPKSQPAQQTDLFQPSLFEPSLFDHEEKGEKLAKIPDDGAGNEKNGRFSTLQTTPHNYHLIDNEEDARKLCDFLLTKQNLSLDTETTSTNAIEAELVELSFAVEENEAWYVAVPAEREQAQKIVNVFKNLYENVNILKIGQNIKYDLEVLRNYNVHLAPPMFDTMIAHYVIQPERRHNMDDMALSYLNYQTIHIDQLIGPKGKGQRSMRDLSPTDVYEYACEDADVTLKLKNRLEPELKKYGADRLFYDIEMPLMPVLAEMEMEGVRIDTEALKETSRTLTERLNSIEAEIYQLAGEQFNIASPKQVGDILFGKMQLVEKAKKTKGGQYVTSEDVLQSLKHKHPIVGKILEHRGLKKLLGTYVDSLPELINPRTGRIHTSFNQTVAATGRLSSSNPNLQNIPIRGEDGKEIRKAFIPEPGCLFFSADYSQIELRVMASLSGDENMIEAFRSNADIHAATAAKIYKKDIADVSRDERTKAKRANFGIIYGITVFGLAERLDISRSEARELIDGYFQTFPRVQQFMNEAIDVARRQGYVETIFHRRRYLPDINSQNATVRGFAERNAINAPIQGSAADIIKVAMIRIFRRFHDEGLRSKMILQVHDELNFSVVPEERERVEQIVTEEMQHAYALRVPLIADCGWGSNWLEAH